MPRKKERSEGDERPAGSDQRDYLGEQDQRGANWDTTPAEVHRGYVERHVGGGAPATPEAYAEAMKQWRRLPGAVRVPATQLEGDTASASPSDEDDSQDMESRS